MKLAYTCIIAGCGCFLVAGFAVLLAILPESSVGHPYLPLAECLNPGIDAPDNWAMAATYVGRIFVCTARPGVLLLALRLALIHRAKRGPVGVVS